MKPADTSIKRTRTTKKNLKWLLLSLPTCIKLKIIIKFHHLTCETPEMQKIALNCHPQIFQYLVLRNLTWLVSQYSTGVLFFISFCFYRACFAHLISSTLSSNLCLWYYDPLVNFHKEIDANVYIYHPSLLRSIQSVSTVHLNGNWHLIWHLLKPVLGGHPVLSGEYSVPRGCPVSTGFTVTSKKFTFAQSKRFPPKHNPPVRGNNSEEQALFWVR